MHTYIYHIAKAYIMYIYILIIMLTPMYSLLDEELKPKQENWENNASVSKWNCLIMF